MKKFHLSLIKPSHYDQDGYVIQWWRSAMPSNSLATLQGIALDCLERQALGNDVELSVEAVDESNTRIQPEVIARRILADGGTGMVGLVGVQTNQYPRALDLARQFRQLGIQVCIGGFHVSGCLAMLPGVTPEIQEAMDMGVSIFAGEAENRLDMVLNDALHGRLKPLYNFMNDLPDLTNAPIPFLPAAQVKRAVGGQASFDAGRGCPFSCSFCTIINVQGKKSRWRSEDDVEKIIRENVAQGIRRFFITDDNFARNKNWEPILDRLIELRKTLVYSLSIQVDTASHRIPRFIEKCGKAGVKRAFLGMESVNVDSLKEAHKPQNKISEYRLTLQAWKRAGVFTMAGYIIGFPNETPESIARDIELIKRELPVDMLEFTLLTPLPGSQDHKELVAKGVPMDPDLNKYDVNQRVIHHPKMTGEEWDRAYRQAWESYYSPEHVVTLMKRAYASRMTPGKVLGTAIWFLATVVAEGVHPLESGYIRRKYRKDRRPGFPTELPIVFHLKLLWEFLAKFLYLLPLAYKLNRERNKILRDPNARNYTDHSLRVDPEQQPAPTPRVVVPLRQTA